MAHSDNSSRIAGSIRFTKEVSVLTLTEITDLMQMHSEPHRWVDLHIRSGGDDGSHIIAFHYILGNSRKKEFDGVVHRLIKHLKEKLGTTVRRNREMPKGVDYWTIATVEYVARSMT